MNVMGELASIVGLTALAGGIIGWCIRTFFPGSVEKKVRQNIARDIDEAMEDAQHLRRALDDKQLELRNVNSELQQLRRKDSSVESGTRAQVNEINDLKRENATVKKTLLDNQSEFNTYRTEKQAELNELRRELATYSAGGSANSERLTEATETVGALRSAVRENDKVIESLRARVKEADTTVETLRSQLKTAESNRSQVQSVSLEYDSKLEDLSQKLEQSNTTIAKQKRDYDLMLENKNADIKNLHTKLEGLGTSSATMQNREHQFKKREEQFKETENRINVEIGDLKRVISDRDAALTKSKQQISKLNTALNTAEQSKKQEVQLLQSELNESVHARSKIKSKSAEVTALNDLLRDSASKRDALQNDLNGLKKALEEKDGRINSLRTELDDVVASRNNVSAQMGELQSQGNLALEKLQQDLNNLAKTRDEYKTRIDSLQSQVTELKQSKEKQSQELTQQAQTEQTKLAEENQKLSAKNTALKSEMKALQAQVKTHSTANEESKARLNSLQSQVSELTQSKENQLRELRTQLTTNSQSVETKLNASNTELTAQNKTLANDLKTLQAKVQDQTRSIETQKTDLQKQIEINQRLNTKLEEKETKLAEFRSKLVREESESQRLNRELSDTEALRLTLTQREAELRTAQINLEDTKSTGGPMQKIVEEHVRKNDSLMAAMRERDEEISRLSAQVTNNSVKSKQQQSSITLLTQEKEAQAELVRSLEKQAENTLQLHTKIAQQSSELEELKARLYERDSNRSATSQQVETTAQKSESNAKPRVFVRADTEALTGATNYASPQRPQFTTDGHRIRRPDGSDELTLLPGVTQTIAGALSRNGVTDFEQVSLWTDREVAHYAERVGVSVQRAEQYNWPKAARSILNGSYSKNGQEIGNS